ncbi:Fc.00g022250.m01.CDS01 [Cosmosporella sp. VM-42]
MDYRRHRSQEGHQAPQPLAPQPAPLPFERVHTILVNLMERTGTLPPGDPASLSEEVIARAIYLAIELAEDVEQTYILGRIMTNEDIALEALQRLQIRDLNRQMPISPQSRVTVGIASLASVDVSNLVCDLGVSSRLVAASSASQKTQSVSPIGQGLYISSDSSLPRLNSHRSCEGIATMVDVLPSFHLTTKVSALSASAGLVWHVEELLMSQASSATMAAKSKMFGTRWIATELSTAQNAEY